MKSRLVLILHILTFSLAFLTFYFSYMRTNRVILNIEQANATLLNKPLNVDGLEVFYRYNGIAPIGNIWQTVYLIRNTGNETIYGKGFTEKNLRDDALQLRISNYRKLLSCDMSDQNCKASLEDDKLNISQWRHDEYIEITILSEGDSAAALSIDDRDIANSKIVYSRSKTRNENNTRLIDRFTNKVGLWITIGYWLLLTVFGLLLNSRLVHSRMDYLMRLEHESKLKYYLYLIIQTFIVLLPQAFFFLWV